MTSGSNRPASRPAQPIPTKPVVGVGITHAGVRIVIVENCAAMSSVSVYTLATGTINLPMRREDSRTAALCAVDTALIDKGPVDALAAAHIDSVLLARAGHGGIVAAANPGRPEEVVVWCSVVDEGTLLGVGARGIESDVVAAAGCFGWLAGHGNLV